jgi:hypothetical protein
VTDIPKTSGALSENVGGPSTSGQTNPPVSTRPDRTGQGPAGVAEERFAGLHSRQSSPVLRQPGAATAAHPDAHYIEAFKRMSGRCAEHSSGASRLSPEQRIDLIESLLRLEADILRRVDGGPVVHRPIKDPHADVSWKKEPLRSAAKGQASDVATELVDEDVERLTLTDASRLGALDTTHGLLAPPGRERLLEATRRLRLEVGGLLSEWLAMPPEQLGAVEVGRMLAIDDKHAVLLPDDRVRLVKLSVAQDVAAAQYRGPTTIDSLPGRSRRQLMQILGLDESVPVPASRLAALLDREIEEFSSYEETFKSLFDRNQEPSYYDAELDAKYARHVMAMCNAEDPGLNGEVFESMADLAHYLNGDPSDDELRIVIRPQRDAFGNHFSAADLRMGADRDSATLIFLDASNYAGQPLDRALETIGGIAEPLSTVPSIRFASAILYTGAQRSPGDCVKYSFSYIRKMRDDPAFFDAIHADLASGRPLNSEPIIPPPPWRLGPDRANRHLAAPDEELPAQVQYFSPNGRHFLPASLYKHAGFLPDLVEMVERRPELGEEKVNKPRQERPAQTLLGRARSHEMSRPSVIMDAMTGELLRNDILVSIEKKRQTDAAKTRGFLAALRDSLRTQ